MKNLRIFFYDNVFLALAALIFAVDLFFPSAQGKFTISEIALGVLLAAALFALFLEFRTTEKIVVRPNSLLAEKNALFLSIFFRYFYAELVIALLLTYALFGAKAGLFIIGLLLFSFERNLYLKYGTKLVASLKKMLEAKKIEVPDLAKLVNLDEVEEIIFEKNSALMRGRYKITSVIPVGELSGETCVSFALTLAGWNENIRDAIRGEVEKVKADPAGIQEVRDFPDHGGSEGMLLGRRILFGNARFMSERKVDLLPVSNWIKVTGRTGEVGMFLAIDDKVQALIAFYDDIKPEARPLLEYLAKRKIKSVALTEDSTAYGQVFKELHKLDEVVSDKNAFEKKGYLESMSTEGKKFIYVTGQDVLLGRTAHSYLVVILTEPKAIHRAPNEITFGSNLADMPVLFEAGELLNKKILSSQKLEGTVLALLHGLIIPSTLMSPYLAAGLALLLRFAGTKQLDVISSVHVPA